MQVLCYKMINNNRLFDVTIHLEYRICHLSQKTSHRCLIMSYPWPWSTVCIVRLIKIQFTTVGINKMALSDIFQSVYYSGRYPR